MVSSARETQPGRKLVIRAYVDLSATPRVGSEKDHSIVHVSRLSPHSPVSRE